VFAIWDRHDPKPFFRRGINLAKRALISTGPKDHAQQLPTRRKMA
jgi:hypothetical protein